MRRLKSSCTVYQVKSNVQLLKMFVFPSACEQTVLRSIPIMSVTKEKKLGVQYLSNEESWLHECIQIRSAVFQVFLKFFTLFDVFSGLLNDFNVRIVPDS